MSMVTEGTGTPDTLSASRVKTGSQSCQSDGAVEVVLGRTAAHSRAEATDVEMPGGGD